MDLYHSAVNSNNETLLFHACSRKRSLKLVRELLIVGSDVNYVNVYNETPLCIACIKNNIRAVKLLVEYGSDINHRNQYGETPLFMAYNREKIVRFLIEKGADVNIPDNYGVTLISKVARFSNCCIVKMVLDAGADVNYVNIFLVHTIQLYV